MIAAASPVDLSGRANDEQIVRLLAIANNPEDPEAAIESARRAGREYRDIGSMTLWGVEEARLVQGVIGVEIAEARVLVLRDLAVSPEARLRGMGRAMIDFVRRELKPQLIRGYTRFSAVDFYRRCGFSVTEDGSLPSGETRYLFEWRIEV